MLLIVTIFMSEFNGSDEIDAAYGAWAANYGITGIDIGSRPIF